MILSSDVAEVAQLVEHFPEEEGVGGSSPPLSTETRKNAPGRFFCLSLCADRRLERLAIRGTIPNVPRQRVRAGASYEYERITSGRRARPSAPYIKSPARGLFMYGAGGTKCMDTLRAGLKDVALLWLFIMPKLRAVSTSTYMSKANLVTWDESLLSTLRQEKMPFGVFSVQVSIFGERRTKILNVSCTKSTFQ